MRKYKWVCEDCGHDSVQAEGTAFWSNAMQEWIWEWHDTFCAECGDLVGLRQEYLPPEVPINSQVI